MVSDKSLRLVLPMGAMNTGDLGETEHVKYLLAAIRCLQSTAASCS